MSSSELQFCYWRRISECPIVIYVSWVYTCVLVYCSKCLPAGKEVYSRHFLCLWVTYRLQSDQIWCLKMQNTPRGSIHRSVDGRGTNRYICILHMMTDRNVTRAKWHDETVTSPSISKRNQPDLIAKKLHYSRRSTTLSYNKYFILYMLHCLISTE